MIRFENISVKYEDEYILKDINTVFRPGVSVISGCSGSGKTTILKLINGVLSYHKNLVSTGNIYIDGKDSSEINITDMDISERSKYISTVFQNPKNQFYCINSYDEIAFGLENKNVSKDDILKKIDDYTDILNTKDTLKSNIFELSGGQRQLLAITSVAVLDQEIYLLDEPSSSLDYDSIERLKNAISILKKMGKTIVVSEHRLYYLMDILDRMYILEDGKMIEYDRESIDRDICKRHCLRSIEKIDKDDIENIIPINTIGNRVSKDFSHTLKCKNYRFSYRNKGVLDMDIGFEKGINFIIGKNGVGKSTFVRCLCNLHKGRWKRKNFLNHFPIKNIRDNISLVMQDVSYQIFTDSVENEIGIVSDDRDKNMKILDEFGLSNLIANHPQTLSGGEKQRLMISISIASSRDIVILDEPTSGLCKYNMIRVIENIKKLSDIGKIVIVVTHDYEFIKLCGGTVFEFI